VLTVDIASALGTIESECGLYLPHPERVTAACDVIRAAVQGSAGAARLIGDDGILQRLLPIPARRSGAVTAPVCGLLEDLARTVPDPRPILDALLSAQGQHARRRAIELLAEQVEAGRLAVESATVARLAEMAESDEPALTSRDALALYDRVIARAGRPAGSVAADPRLSLFFDGSAPRVQRFAARLLDLSDTPPAAAVARRMLGEEAHAVLAPYLDFTRASHLDLADAALLTRTPGAIASIRDAESVCGQAVMRDTISAIGWARVNLGIEARPVVGLGLGESLPLIMSPTEARLFDAIPGVRVVFSRIVLVAAGGRETASSGGRGPEGAVARFRAYNITHAEVLGDLLDVAPLTRTRLAAILGRLDRLVDDFGALFGASEEASARNTAAAVRRVYADLRARVDDASARHECDPLPMDVCRLVLPFEDPDRPEAVRTLHGLKRYLHQIGLKLAFGLIGAGPKTTTTVDIALAAPGRPVEVGRHVEFVDLEGAEGEGHAPPVPHAVRLVVDAFTQQLLHGQRIASHVRVFCYGTEVHYFVRFRNHPAFIRIDFSPPLRGGMIDLQYLGVSNFDLDVHPCVTLDAIRRVFERLDFIVTVDATRIHARYDKERAFSLDQLADRTRILFGLVPYLMDLDWTIGSLPLSARARHLVIEAWAERFARWGVLPYDQFLARDRSGVLVGHAAVTDQARGCVRG